MRTFALAIHCVPCLPWLCSEWQLDHCAHLLYGLLSVFVRSLQ
uniref:Uncharacterized protein n=1 Tax=Arundo donax TaxID=35708 RepID=A0A0A8Y9R1_ARUDO